MALARERLQILLTHERGTTGQSGLIAMLREDILGPDRFDPAFRKFIRDWAYKHPQPSDFFRTMANRPEVLKAFVPLYGAIMGFGVVDRRIKELAYLAAPGLCAGKRVVGDKI